MTLNGAMSVRVSDGRTERMVTRHCSGLRFTKVAPGGHQSLAVSVTLPRGFFDDLGPQDRIWVDDQRTARCVFDGYLENPTPVDGPQGQSYDLSAVGGMALANDETRPLVYVDGDLGQFEKAPDAADSSNVETGEWVTNPFYDRVRVSVPGGSLAATGAFASAGNYMFERARMSLGGIRVGDIVSGKDSADWAQEFATTDGVEATGVMNTTGGTLELFVVDDFIPDIGRFAFRLTRTGAATNVADDDTWTDWVDYSAVGQRMDRFGTLLEGSAGLVSATSVLASQVVEDLLGRVLTMCDPGIAIVDESTFEIDQLAYHDGAKAADILTGLAVWEPDLWWGIHESNQVGHRFTYQGWGTEPRYEVSVKDGWRQTGSDVDLCNRILVSWTDAAGKKQTLPVTAADIGLAGIGLPVDALGNRIKDADPVTLPEGRGSAANALQIGGAILRDKIAPPVAGGVTIRRPILDRFTGSRVMPWEIEPGYLCRVREPGLDLRLTKVDYDDPSVSVQCTLGRPVPTEEQRLARLERVTQRTAA